MVNQVGSPAILDGNMFLPETGTPIWKIERIRTVLAVWLPDPLTVAICMEKSLTTVWPGSLTRGSAGDTSSVDIYRSPCLGWCPFHYSSYLLYDGRGWGLGGGSFGDLGDEIEHPLDFVRGVGTVGLVVAQGGFGVLAGVGEAAGLREHEGDVIAGRCGVVEIALHFEQADRLAVVMQGMVEVAAGVVDGAQLAMSRSQLADGVRRRHFQTFAAPAQGVVEVPQEFGLRLLRRTSLQESLVSDDTKLDEAGRPEHLIALGS